MSVFLFGYYNIGLKALNAARLGLQVAGDNISNVSTPGYAKRRVDLRSGFPVRVQGGFLDMGVEVDKIRRVANRFVQASLEHEQGNLAGAQEQLRGLGDLQTLFGSVDGESILSAYAEFSNAFTELAGNPENLAERRAAIAATDNLARQIRDTYHRIKSQQTQENLAIEATVKEVNDLADAMATLNREIFSAEVDGSTAAPLRDERNRIIQQLAVLTGGSAVEGEDGKTLFSLRGGPMLVTGENSVPLKVTHDGAGLARLESASRDFTANLRGGRLGALLSIRDDQIAPQLANLDALANDLIVRANGLTVGATDLEGNPGNLFKPNLPVGVGAAGVLEVSPNLLLHAERLAISGTGEPGDGSVALAISELRLTGSAGLGGLSPADYLTDALTSLGGQIVQLDVEKNVAEGLVQNFQNRRDEISGVSLDEEALELIRHERAYQAAARFMQVLNEVSEIAITIGQ